MAHLEEEGEGEFELQERKIGIATDRDRDDQPLRQSLKDSNEKPPPPLPHASYGHGLQSRTPKNEFGKSTAAVAHGVDGPSVHVVDDKDIRINVSTARYPKLAMQIIWLATIVSCFGLFVSLIYRGDNLEGLGSGGKADFAFNIIFVFLFCSWMAVIARKRIWKDQEIPLHDSAICFVFSLISFLLGVNPDFYGTSATVFAWALTASLWAYIAVGSTAIREWKVERFGS